MGFRRAIGTGLGLGLAVLVILALQAGAERLPNVYRSVSDIVFPPTPMPTLTCDSPESLIVERLHVEDRGRRGNAYAYWVSWAVRNTCNYAATLNGYWVIGTAADGSYVSDTMLDAGEKPVVLVGHSSLGRGQEIRSRAPVGVWEIRPQFRIGGS